VLFPISYREQSPRAAGRDGIDCGDTRGDIFTFFSRLSTLEFLLLLKGSSRLVELCILSSNIDTKEAWVWPLSIRLVRQPPS
jgi:hypothetical protein